MLTATEVIAERAPMIMTASALSERTPIYGRRDIPSAHKISRGRFRTAGGRPESLCKRDDDAS